jgi:hypothetical protein
MFYIFAAFLTSFVLLNRTEAVESMQPPRPGRDDPGLVAIGIDGVGKEQVVGSCSLYSDISSIPGTYMLGNPCLILLFSKFSFLIT